MYSDTIKNIISIQNKKTERDLQLKRKHIQIVHEKINNYANLGKKECLYVVPTFIIGFSPYEITEITRHIYKVLKKEGFYINILTNECLYISWDMKLLFKDDENTKNKNKTK